MTTEQELEEARAIIQQAAQEIEDLTWKLRAAEAQMDRVKSYFVETLGCNWAAFDANEFTLNILAIVGDIQRRSDQFKRWWEDALRTFHYPDGNSPALGGQASSELR